jgi:hypothetical protein
MFSILAEKDEVLSDIPNIYSEWLDMAKKLKNDLDESKFEFFYSYGFFHPKVEDKDKYYTELYEKYSVMLFEERLQHELSKVRVDFTMKNGHLVISNRLEKGTIPDIVKSIVTEITKVKMLLEYEYNGNEEVKESIPEVDTNIVSFEIIKDAVDNEYSKSKNFDIDYILDKISNNGLDSLSDEEKEFLDKKSKDL